MAGETLSTLKKIDFAGQVGMLLLPGMAGLFMHRLSGLYSGFVTGVWLICRWQMISFLVHLGFRRALWISGRRWLYGIGIFLFLLLIVTSLFVPVLILMSFWTLPLAILCMAGFYFFITAEELNAMKRIDSVNAFGHLSKLP